VPTSKGRVRAAAKRRVSARKQSAGPRQGSPDWILSRIDRRYVETLIGARRVGLPLETAAAMAGVDLEVAATWLKHGRELGKLGARKASQPYLEMCRELAVEWDKAIPGLVAVLRGYMLGHAKRDPKACVQALASYEREYVERRRRAHRPAPELPAHLAELGEDLFEPFVPLELAPPGSGAAPRSAKFTRTNPDGSSTSVELTEGEGELDERSDEDLEHYATHGLWPEEVSRPHVELGEGGLIDAEGEPVALEQVLDQAAELEQALAGELTPTRPSARPGKPPPAAAGAGPGPRPAPAPMPTPPHAPLRRLDPLAGLRDTGPTGQVIDAAAAAPASSAPEAPTLRRVDPLEGR